MFKVRNLALFIGLMGLAALPSFASLMREPFTPGDAPFSKDARNKRPERLVHHDFGTSPDAPDNSYTAGTQNPATSNSGGDANLNDSNLPYMPPASWLNWGPNSPYSLGDLNPQPGYGPGPGAFFWQPGGNASKDFGADASQGDPPNPAAYVSDPPPGSGMLTQTPEPAGLVYAALAGFAIGGLIRTLGGKKFGWFATSKAKES